MFGYIRLHKDELKIREYYHFRAYYCGLCMELKQRYGQMSRFLLNYDVTFLGLFLSSLTCTREKTALKKCFLHPVKKRPVIVDNTWLSYAADVNILLAYHNIKDNWADDRSPAARSGLVLLGKAYREAARLHPEIDQLIDEQTRELSRLEQEKSPHIDAAADTFAKILENICPTGGLQESAAKAVKWLCYNLGKWIYLIDAFDDLPEDIKKERYNPFLYGFHYQGEACEKFQESIRPKAEFLLTYSLSQIAASYQLLDMPANRGILENIIYLGMNRQTDHVLNRRSCGKSEKKLLRNSWCQGECFERRDS
ncbi:hypothetical protein DCMF_28590 [Candidatus Formimonas warabiya]|uniref:Uncharacterized protein n=2 Tax=Formimonas warabiya TaxID=1761012 RepID=A0A3G1L0L0_FORW1|nr:DUF5685 family protein [Candidatus Formimonas warabiya]ATW28188.1 hypothetical protein DCMF_28590 [Candidatus Formimonas warabiya]